MVSNVNQSMILDEKFQRLHMCVRLSAMEPIKKEFIIRFDIRDHIPTNRASDYDGASSVNISASDYYGAYSVNDTRDHLSTNRGSDYDGAFFVKFKTGSIDGKEICVDISIYDDDILEESASVFLFAMNTQNSFVILDPPVHITLLDNDG